MGAADHWMNPQYVQITRTEAAKILGRSPAEFDRLRAEDDDCPKGFKEGNHRGARVRFRLSDVYRYSDVLMQRATGG